MTKEQKIIHRQDTKDGNPVGASLAKPATADRAQTGRASATPTWRAWQLGGALLLLCNLAACVTTSAPSNIAATAGKSDQVVEQPKPPVAGVGSPGWFAAVAAVVRVQVGLPPWRPWCG
ncbi:MAG: hypothetical protein NTY53_10820 [Kiritimatiellaeota bacterium]|nr:hypothetical protein [Kiritimatiellota bacterium]